MGKMLEAIKQAFTKEKDLTGDEKMKNKKQRLGFAKSIDDERKVVKAVVSTYEWDRTMERFSPGAWDLENYKKNPVVLWGHDGSEPPIGRALSIQETDDGLVAETEFDTGSERGMEIFGLYQRGFLNAFSVGFLPKTHIVDVVQGTNEKGIVFTGAELLEYSAVSIPANPGAVIGREVAELAIKSLGNDAVSVLVDGDKKIFKVPGEAPVKEEKKADEVKDFEEALNQIVALSRIVKGKPLDETKLSLIGQATSAMNEIIMEKTDSVSREDMERLMSVVKTLGDVLINTRPGSRDSVLKTLEQMKRAIGK